MAYSGTWEKIEQREGHYCYESFRLKVPGGWLVRTMCYHFGQLAVAVIFFADASYSWEFE